MSKRFTDTEKWNKRWYRLLTPAEKCLWQYLCDNCDLAGVWEPDFDLASFHINEVVSKETLDKFGHRVEWLSSGKLLVKQFLEFQYKRLDGLCRAHKPVLELINKHGLMNTLSIPYQHILDRDKEQEQDKDKEPETEPEAMAPNSDASIPTLAECRQYAGSAHCTFRPDRAVEWFADQEANEWKYARNWRARMRADSCKPYWSKPANGSAPSGRKVHHAT